MIECNEDCINYVNAQIKKWQLKQYKKTYREKFSKSV